MLSALERQAEIAQTTQTAGHVSVSQLSSHFNVTPETIRRDLKALEKRGRLVRVHGGAVSVSPNQNVEMEYDSNSMVNIDKKKRIAAAAWNRLQQLPQLNAITIDSGTTTLEFVRALASGGKTPQMSSMTMITNSLPVANLTTDYGLTGVHLVGGRIRPLTRAIVGDQTVRELQQLRADVAVLGANGLSLDHGCSTPDPSEAAVKAAMVQSAHKVMVLCDSTKFKKDFLVTFAPLDSIDIVVTDSAVIPQHYEILESLGIEVVVA